jgi:quinol monooxygenase YgiN
VFGLPDQDEGANSELSFRRTAADWNLCEACLTQRIRNAREKIQRDYVFDGNSDLIKRRPSVLKMLSAVLGPTKAAPGCLAARLYSGSEQSTAVLLLEEWRSRADFELSLYPARIKAIIAAIGLSTQPPIVRLDTVERRQGLDGLGLHLRQDCTSRRQPE